MPSEIRKDYLLNKYAIIAPKRGKRPHDVKKTKCPLCSGQITARVIDQIGTNINLQVTSLDNPFPAVTPKNKKAYGYQEVIVETTDHNKQLADLSEKQIELVLKMFAKRTSQLSRDKKIDYVLCFKNYGAKAGASLEHSHSQIFATQILPPDIKEELDLAKKYKKKNKTCFYCDLIKKESKSKRFIWSDKNMTAFAPMASQYTYEAWIFSNRHIDNITQLNKNELRSLAKILKRLLAKIKKLNLSYNFFLHQVISNHDQHFCLKIQPRGNTFGGVELGSGLIINSVSPEEAARFLKK